MRVKLNLEAKPTYSEAYKELHTRFDVPLHGLTPQQTRFFHYAFRNEVNVFFRTCDLTGEKMISQFPPEAPFPIYRHDLWWTKDFPVPEAEYDPSRSFFEQCRQLQLLVPRMSTACDSTSENSPYVNCTNHCRNCHMVFATGDCQDCLYCVNTERSETCMDMNIAHECTLCYELVSCRKCYNLDFSAYCNECSDSQFLYDCRRCQHCFMCTGLVGKEYCILNKEHSKLEYERKLRELHPLTQEKIDECYQKLEEIRKFHPHKYANIVGSERCTGNDTNFCQDCSNSYIMEYSQNCLNSSSLRNCKDCLDFDLWGDPGELCYHSMSCGYHVYYLRMCFDCWNNCRYLTYCDSCPGSEECFGCIGLKNRKFCVLNKQYSEAEYRSLVDRIIADMSQRGEWGQFFPPSCSPYPLNCTMAHEYFHTSPELASQLGFTWRDMSDEQEYNSALVYRGSMMSADVQPEQILGKALLCTESGRPFNIQPRELEILKRKNLPLPNHHWRTRLEKRVERFIFSWELVKRVTIDTNNAVESPVPEKYQIREEIRA